MTAFTQSLQQPRDIQQPHDQSGKPIFITVPGAWNDFPIDGKPMGAKGYGTYRLRVLLPNTESGKGESTNEGEKSLSRLHSLIHNPTIPTLGIKIPQIGTAYELWINGKQFASGGKVSKSEETASPGLNLELVQCEKEDIQNLSNGTQQIDLIIKVSNYHEGYGGGLWNSLKIGKYKILSENLKWTTIADFFLFGAILIMGLYHLGLYQLRKKDPSALWFGIYCLMIFARILLTGEKHLERLIPNSYKLFLFLEYSNLVLLIPVFAIFLYHIFPEEFSNRVRKGFVLVGCLFTIPIFFLPSFFYTRILTSVQVYTFIACKAFSYEKLSEDKYQYLMNKKVPISMEGGMLYLTYKRQKPFYLSKIPKFEFEIDKEFIETLSVSAFLYVPLISKNQTIGILGFSNLEKEMKLSKKDIQSISNLCSQVAGVIETAHLLEDIAKANREADSIQIIYTPKHKSLPIQGLQEFLGRNALKLSDSSHVQGYVYQLKKSVYTKELRKSENEYEKKMIDLFRLKSFLCIPLILNEFVIGFLSFGKYNEVMDLSEDEIHSLEKIAEQLTGAIYNSNLLKQAEEAKKIADAEKEKALVAQTETEKAKTEIKFLNECSKTIMV